MMPAVGEETLELEGGSSSSTVRLRFILQTPATESDEAEMKREREENTRNKTSKVQNIRTMRVYEETICVF